jgi:WD40 repeat protein
MTLSPDTRLLSVGSWSSAWVIDARSGQQVAGPLSHGLKKVAGGIQGGVNHTAFSKDGKWVVTDSVDGTARVWDVATGMAVSVPLKHTDQVPAAAFSPDGSRVATGSHDGTACLWDPRTGELVLPPLRHQGHVIRVEFSPDGRSDIPRALLSDDARRLTLVGRESAREWDLGGDERPADDLVRLAVLLSGHAIDSSGGATPVDRAELLRIWEALRRKYPKDFGTDGANPDGTQ